jgi:hypothetical protein
MLAVTSMKQLGKPKMWDILQHLSSANVTEENKKE